MLSVRIIYLLYKSSKVPFPLKFLRNFLRKEYYSQEISNFSGNGPFELSYFCGLFSNYHVLSWFSKTVMKLSLKLRLKISINSAATQLNLISPGCPT